MPNSAFRVDDLAAANSIAIGTVSITVSNGNLVLPVGTTVGNTAIAAGGSGATGATGIQGNIGATGPAGATGAGSFAYGNTAPTSPTIGSRWLDSESGKEFIWVVAGATGVWMQAVGGGGAGNRGGTSPGGAALQTNQTNAYGTLIGYGNTGGIGTASGEPIQPAGGGGAGGPGGPGISSSPTKAGDGGLGIYNTLRTGANIGYGGGGTGQPYNSAVNPINNRDTFGGGVSTSNDVVNGVANTGGGGGGAGFAPYSGPSAQGGGGSGILVVRYDGNVRGTGGTITNYTLANVYYTVHTFTTSGTLTFT